MSRFVVGITGGIGSGKSAAAAFFADQSIVVVDADMVARMVVEPGQPALESIENHFGKNILNPDGSLNRRQLRGIIFTNRQEKVWLEQLLHPIIRQHIHRALAAADSEYAVLVSPLLLETNQHKQANRILVIDAPKATQIERTKKRDSVSATHVESIIRQQTTRETRQNLADDLVINDDTLEALKRKLEPLHQKYLALAQNN